MRGLYGFWGWEGAELGQPRGSSGLGRKGRGNGGEDKWVSSCVYVCRVYRDLECGKWVSIGGLKRCHVTIFLVQI